MSRRPSSPCWLAAAIVVLAPWTGGAVRPPWSEFGELGAGLLLALLALRPRALLRPPRPGERPAVLACALLLGLITAQLLPLGGLLDFISPRSGELRAEGWSAGAAPASTISLYPYLTRVGLLAAAAAAVLGLCGARALRTLGEARFLAGALVLSAALQALLALGQLVATGGASARPSGSYPSPNHLAGLCALALPLCLALARVERGQRQGRGRRLWWIPAVLLVGGVLVSGSRSGAVACVAGLSTFALCAAAPGHRRLRARLKHLALSAALVAAAGLAIGLGPLRERFGHLLASDPVLIRLEAWRTAWDIAGELPLVGSGLRTFPELSPARIAFARIVRSAHNDPLNLLSDTGVPGAILGLTLLAGWLLALGHALRRLPAGRRRTLLAGAAGGVFALLAASPVEFNLHIHANLWAWALCGGLALGAPGLERATPRGSLRWQHQALRGALLVGALVLASAAGRFAAAALLQRHAEEAPDPAALLLRAESWAPEDAGLALAGGEALAQAGDGPSSIAAYRRACARRPRDARAHLGLARQLLLTHQTEEGLRELATATRLAPHFPRYQLTAGLLGQWAQRHRDAGPAALEEALACYRRVLVAEPARLRSLLPQLRDLDGPLLERALPPGALALRVELAEALAAAGRGAAAARLLAPAAQSPGAGPAVIERWARLELEEGNGDLAAAAFRRAVSAAAPGSRRPPAARAWRALRSAGFPDAGLGLLWELVARFPRDAGLRRELAEVLLAERAPGVALKVLSEAEAAPSLEASRLTARAHHASGRPDAALRALRDGLALARTPREEARQRLELARLLRERSPEEARDELVRAARLAPGDALIAEELARAQRALGE